jgi:DNA-3-methyladenine glycosylase I
LSNLAEGHDGQRRCRWSEAAPEFFDYHETEWGYPEGDDNRIFEKLCLESFQSGLSWRTIMAKRENFRAAFEDFNFDKVACFDDCDIERLVTNKGIVRHRGKIEAAVNNAKMARALVKQEGSLSAFFWRYEVEHGPGPARQNVSTSPESISLSKDLKKRGWKFVGPTTVYAFMQAMGLVNDHAEGCIIRDKVMQARENFIAQGST